MDSNAISIKLNPSIVRELYSIVTKNVKTNYNSNMSKINKALKAASDTRALYIGSGILIKTSDLFKEQFPAKKAVIVADSITFDIAGKDVYSILKSAGIEQEEPFIFTDPDLYAEYSYIDQLVSSLKEHGFNMTEWLRIWGTIFTGNIIANLLFGFIGDRIGWRNTIIWFGGVGCCISTLLLYYAPLFFYGNLVIVMLVGVLWGFLLAGYVPLSALVPSLVTNDKGAAMAVLNLGAGLPVFVGPLIVGISYSFIGSEGVIWMLAGLYLLSAFLTNFITLPDNSKILN